MAVKTALCLFCLILISSTCKASSVFSWLTGGDSIVPRDLEAQKSHSFPDSPYPGENGECAHWGNGILSSFSAIDPTYSNIGLPGGLGGALIGSHKSAPIGSIVAVTNVNNGKTIKVRVVPPQKAPVMGRVMDLSPAAFSQLGLLSDAVIPCTVKIIQTPGGSPGQILSFTSHTFDNGGIRKPAFPSPPTLISTGSIHSVRDSFEDNTCKSITQNWSW